MDKIKELEDRITKLEKLLIMKILGNDTSTNYGLPAQTILYGLQQVGSLSLTKNGVQTTINNATDPDIGQPVSLSSVDVSVPNGDKSAIAPTAFFVLAWDGAAYQTIFFAGDSGSATGDITLSDAFGPAQVVIEASTPQVQVTDGAGATSVLLPNGIIVDNAVGVSGVFVAGGFTITVHKGIISSIV